MTSDKDMSVQCTSTFSEGFHIHSLYFSGSSLFPYDKTDHEGLSFKNPISWRKILMWEKMFNVQFISWRDNWGDTNYSYLIKNSTSTYFLFPFCWQGKHFKMFLYYLVIFCMEELGEFCFSFLHTRSLSVIQGAELRNMENSPFLLL